MAKDLLTEYVESFFKSSRHNSGRNGRNPSKVDSFGQEYRFELGLLLIAGVVYGAFFVATHRSPAAAGALFGFVAIVGLFVRPVRRTLRRNLYMAKIRRNWDRAVFHCEFKHKIAVLSVEPVSVGHRMRVRVGKGISFAHLDRQREALAACLAVREVRIKRDTHNAATGTVTLVKNDPLAEVAGTTWPGIRHFRGEARRSTRVRQPEAKSARVPFTKERRTPPSDDDGSTSVWDPIQIGVGEHGETITISLPERNLLIGGNPGSGKALDINTPVPTPDGWKTMGSLRKGSKLFDETGHVCMVTDAWDVRYDRPCYELVFDDGSTIVSDEDHLWVTETRYDRLGQRKESSRKRAKILSDLVLGKLRTIADEEGEITVPELMERVGPAIGAVPYRVAKTVPSRMGTRWVVARRRGGVARWEKKVR